MVVQESQLTFVFPSPPPKKNKASIFNVIHFLSPHLFFSASQCAPLPEVENARADILAGRGLNYGTVVRYTCDEGFERGGMPVLLCQSNGTWSSPVPSCSR